MTDKETKDILSNLDSKIVKYIGKKVMEDVESKIDDLIPNKDKKKNDNKTPEDKTINPPAQEKTNTNKEDQEEKSIVDSIDDKLGELIGKDTANEIEEDLLALMPGHIDNVDDLGSRLDSFLTETNHFGIETEESTNTDAQKTEEKFTNHKVEDELQKLKQAIKTGNKDINNIETNEKLIPKSNDKTIEKKFKDREIEDALEALKAKCSTKKEQPEKLYPKAKQNQENTISNEEIDSSLQDLLKNLDKK